MKLDSRRPLARGFLLAASSLALAISPTIVAAQANSSQQIELPAQPLSQALAELARRYGIDFVAPQQLTRGKMAPRISGRMTAAQALQRLLAGSGLTYRRSRDGRYVVARAQSNPTPSQSVKQSTKEPVSTAAQTQESEGTPIIVTGTKKGLSLQDTQTSAVVITAEQIRDQVLIDAEDIFFRTANVSTGGNGTLNQLSIRGISSGGVGGAGIGNTINVYVDGAPNSGAANIAAANLWDVDQVEVLRGPQSTVQGRNALAGAVIIQTADPEYLFGGNARVLIGNNDQRQYSGVITGPIIADQVAFRLAGDYREVDFGVLNVSDENERSRFQEALSLRGKLLFEPIALDGLRIELIGSYDETDSGDFNSIFGPSPIVSVTENVPTLIPGALEELDIFGDETAGQSGARLENTQVARAIVDLEYTVNDNWILNALGTFEDTDQETRFPGTLDVSLDETYQAEIRANFDYGQLTGWFGGYFFREETASTRTINTAFADIGVPTVPADSTLTASSEQTITTRNYAVFGDVSYTVNDKWEFNVGARIDFEDFEDSGVTGSAVSDPADCIIDPNVPFPVAGFPCTIISPTQNVDPEPPADFSAFLPRGSVTYNIDDLRSVSLTIARGYRAGGAYFRNVIDENNQVVGGEADSFDPEFVTSVDFAFRSLWLNNRLRFNANVFYTDWTNQQVVIAGPTGLRDDFTIENAGGSEIYGLEIDAGFQITDNLEVFGSLGLLETEFTDFPFAIIGAAGDPAFENLAGNEFNQAPSITAAAGFSYQSSTGFFLAGNVAYSGERFSDVENFEIEKANDFVLANARAGYRAGSFEISLFANNLFDERFITAQNIVNVNTNTGVVRANGSPRFTVNDPRLFGAELRLDF